MERTTETALRACDRHNGFFVADAHFDLLPLVLKKRLKGRTKVIETDYLPSIREGGVDLVISAASC